MPVTEHDGLELRPIRDEEFEAWSTMLHRAFGEEPDKETLAVHRAETEFDRTIGAFRGERPVGSASSLSRTISLPGAEPVGCAAVTDVSVSSDHRRRGLLNVMMRMLLDQARARGEPFASLYASETVIYGRYGFGPAVPALGFELDRAGATLVVPGDTSGVELVEPAEAISRVPSISEAARTSRGGWIDRPEAWWQSNLGNDPESWRDGFSKRYHAVLEDRGFVTYRIKSDWKREVPNSTLRVIEFVATDADAAAGLWQFLFGVDLVASITASGRPIDDPLADMMVHRNRLVTSSSEAMFLRCLDVPTCLTARGYHVSDRLVLAVHDEQVADNTGSWELIAGPDGVSCEPTDDAPDLEMDLADLGTILLGGVPATRLVGARRIVEHSMGAAARANRLFAVDHAPWNPFGY